MTFSIASLKSVLPPEDSVTRFWVALSGGLDSMVLLHAMAALKLSTPLMALHVNHQISPHADSWQQACALFCEQLGVPFYTEKVAVNRAGRGLEDAARNARYEVFERYVHAGDLLLTAHHADDQAETLLLRLLRGAGPRGLAAMARQRALGSGQLYRPLLAYSRADLQAYATAENLTWVDDESNLDSHYDRNFLRHQVIPVLRLRWPHLARRFQQTADLCADNETLLLELAASDLAIAAQRAERLGQSISLIALQQLSVPRRHNLLRFWLREQGHDQPETLHLAQFEEQFIAGREDAESAISWGNLVLHRYRGRLYAQSRFAKTEDECASSNPQSFPLAAQSLRIELPGGGVLDFAYCESISEPGYLRIDLPNLSLRYRQGGERCQPEGRGHSQTLKKLLQEFALEPWWREQIPLIFSGDVLVAVGDLWVCSGFTASPGQPGHRLSWVPGDSSF